MYLPFLGESDLGNGGVISPSFITGLNASLADFLDTMTTDSLSMVLLHADSTAPLSVSDLLAQGVAATQRRRLRR